MSLIDRKEGHDQGRGKRPSFFLYAEHMQSIDLRGTGHDGHEPARHRQSTA